MNYIIYNTIDIIYSINYIIYNLINIMYQNTLYHV